MVFKTFLARIRKFNGATFLSCIFFTESLINFVFCAYSNKAKANTCLYKALASFEYAQEENKKFIKESTPVLVNIFALKFQEKFGELQLEGGRDTETARAPLLPQVREGELVFQ